MNRPLVITDCDEVLMHMVVPFAQWVDEAHGVEFRMEDASFAGALKRKECGTTLESAEIWPLLDSFFTTEMARQTPIAGSIAAIQRLALVADVVILTNVGPEHQAARTAQLAEVGLNFPVVGNRGGKGEPVARLLDDYAPSVAIFIDDLGMHHASVAEYAPAVWRLHLVGEPAIAARVKPSGAAHARIDDWTEAEAWISQRMAEDAPAPLTEKL